ncbi:MAG: hypothetical protein ACT4PT_01490 [Methanobacteriota archaeon]
MPAAKKVKPVARVARIRTPPAKDALIAALVKKFDMAPPDAEEIASVVADQFNGEAEVNDERLTPEIRSIFYTLEAKRLLAFRREEYSIETGERRRAFFWRVRDEELSGLDEAPTADREDDVYESLPATAWNRQSVS